MIVVSDTSPLTALLTIGRAELLHLLFSRVIIPPAVEAELLHENPTLPAWIEVLSPTHISPAISAARLDLGETQALALALELHARTLLMDERLGRRVAQALGLSPTGVLGCLVLAKQDGHLTAVAPLNLRIARPRWLLVRRRAHRRHPPRRWRRVIALFPSRSQS